MQECLKIVDTHRAQNPTVLDTHYDAIRTAMRGVFQELGLAA